jgi:PAT family beta-lactamase induction signal transducer AmpG
MAQQQISGSKNPWSFVPSLYFAQGIPFIIVNQLSVAMLKSMGVSNELIGLTNFLYLPWSFKFLWSPIVDSRNTKRWWLIMMQFVLAVGFLSMAIVMKVSPDLMPMIIIFSMIAFVSATHDIAIDGYYLYALDDGNQALFSGIRSAFYRVAMIFSGGLLAFIAGEVGTKYLDIRFGWVVSFAVASIVMFSIWIYHRFTLPNVEINRVKSETKESIPFAKIFKDYFKQDKIGVVIAFILVYRLGEAILLKMVQPFLMDKPEAGGLGIPLKDVGIIYGTFGILALVFGGILGGWLVKKYGLRKAILPLAFIMHLPNLLYVYLAATLPTGHWGVNLFSISFNIYPIAQICVLLEQFGYGIGFTAFMVFLLRTSKGEYKTSHYAISTGIMALGMILPGAVSGIIQHSAGYFWLFLICSILTIPSLLLIKFLPIGDDNIKG